MYLFIQLFSENVILLNKILNNKININNIITRLCIVTSCRLLHRSGAGTYRVGVVWRHDVMADVNRSAQFLKSEPEGASSVIPPRSQTQRFIRVINIKAVLD